MTVASVALVNDRPLVLAGLRRIIAEHSETLEVVDIELGGSDVAPVDIALFDTAFADDVMSRAVELRDDGVIGHLVVYTWEDDDDLDDMGESLKDVHVVQKSVAARDMVEFLESLPVSEASRILQADRRRPVRPSELSKRELDVISLVAAGKTNTQISEILDLSPHTIKTYVQRSAHKLGVRTRTEVAAWAGHHGLVDFD